MRCGNMVTAIEWDISGTYFESCNCDTVCPCVFLSARLHAYWCLDSFGDYRSYIRTPCSNGFPLLIGIVVTNAIVLIPFVEQLRERGLSIYDALIQGGLVGYDLF